MADRESDLFKTRELSSAEAARLAAGGASGEIYDGRFGERFDDEINLPSVIWVTVSIAVITALGFLGAWMLYDWQIDSAEATASAPAVVLDEARERRLPAGPRLQARPESELQALRREMEERLTSYGWSNEGRGLVHIPIDAAMDRILEQGLPAAAPAPAAETATGAEASP